MLTLWFSRVVDGLSTDGAGCSKQGAGVSVGGDGSEIGRDALLALLFQPQACNALAVEVQRSRSEAPCSGLPCPPRRMMGLLARFLFGWLSAVGPHPRGARHGLLGAYFLERRRRGNGVDAAPSTTRR